MVALENYTIEYIGSGMLRTHDGDFILVYSDEVGSAMFTVVPHPPLVLIGVTNQDINKKSYVIRRIPNTLQESNQVGSKLEGESFERRKMILERIYSYISNNLKYKNISYL